MLSTCWRMTWCVCLGAGNSALCRHQQVGSDADTLAREMTKKSRLLNRGLKHKKSTKLSFV